LIQIVRAGFEPVLSSFSAIEAMPKALRFPGAAEEPETFDRPRFDPIKGFFNPIVVNAHHLPRPRRSQTREIYGDRLRGLKR
jgi:hypothetical protein